MKKLLVVLILAVVLSLTFATPAFAGGPPDSMPEGGKAGLENAVSHFWYMMGYAYNFIYRLLHGAIPPPWWV